MMRHTRVMPEDQKTAAMRRLRRAAARVRQHEADRKELADAIVAARFAGWRPVEVEKEVPYDRNHVTRIARAGGVPTRTQRTPTAD